MIWSYNEDKKVWILSDNDSIAAKIFLKDKEGQINAFVAKTLISSIYSSNRTFKKLTQSNKNWKSKIRKFKTKEDREDYINIKKSAVIKQLETF